MSSALKEQGLCARIPAVRQYARQLLCLVMILMVVGCYPAQVQYPYCAAVVEKRRTLKDELLLLLPESQRTLPDAAEEAVWLADTAYKAAAGISRINGSWFPGWAGNALVNARLQDRGLCWHYQHDMYRELRRRPLKYFRLGCCVRDGGFPTEHNCLYIAAAGSPWPECWVLDAWMWNGRLKVDKATDLNLRRWNDRPAVCEIQSTCYPEGHTWPIEHWSVLRSTDGSYQGYWMEETRRSSQYQRMYDNIMEGMKEHPGSPTNY